MTCWGFLDSAQANCEMQTCHYRVCSGLERPWLKAAHRFFRCLRDGVDTDECIPKYGGDNPKMVGVNLIP